MKTVFVTGATGFVGSHTASLFLKEGWHVKALVRRPDRPGLLPAGTEVVPGDLLEADRYRDALRGCDAVVHVAGAVKALNLAGYEAVNVEGAQAIARAADESCPEAMFVLVSSQAAAGPARTGAPVTENDPPAPVSWYGQSKLAGEEAVARTFRGNWCIVRPCVVYGPGDPGVLELFRTIQRGWAPVVAGGRMRVQLIAVEDLARVLFVAARRPDLKGRRGFAAVDTVTMNDLTEVIAQLRNPPARRISVPTMAVRLVGVLETLREQITRSARPFNRDKARELLQRDWICDSAPFLQALDVAGFMHWREGIPRLCRYYVNAQRLRPDLWTV